MKTLSRIILYLLIAFLTISMLWLLSEHEIDFQHVLSIKTKEAFLRPHTYEWTKGWDGVFETGFFSPEIFEKRFYELTGKFIGDICEMNYDDYTYIVCFGFELHKLTYRECDMVGRFTGPYPWYIGKAYLSDDCDPSQLTIYKIDHFRIGQDAHRNTLGRSIVISQ